MPDAHAARGVCDSQRFARHVAPGRGFRRRLSAFRRCYRYADRGWHARVPGARREARRDDAGAPGDSTAAGRRPLPGVTFADARKRLLVLRARVAVPAGRGLHRKRRGARGARARGDAGHVGERTGGARHRAGVRLSGIDDVAQPQPDPRDGAARHSGPLPRVVSAARSGRSSIRCC